VQTQRQPNWIVLMVCGAIIVATSMGVRQSFGLFLSPISVDLGIGREVFSLTIAIQNLCFGLMLPLVGMLADRFGARWVLIVGMVFYSLGLLLTAQARTATDLHLVAGLLVGVAQSATTFVVIFGALAQATPGARRSLAFGIVTAGGSLGMFAMVPIAQGLESGLGWRGALMVLALAVVAVILPALPMRGGANQAQDDQSAASLNLALAEAGRHRGYWLLNAGFFVCGFHVAFIATHLPAFLGDMAVHPGTAANALALIGLFNIGGSYLFGALGGRLPKKRVLSAIYLGRALVIGSFVLLPVSQFSALLFGALIGLLWLGTVPLTSGIVGQIFGVRYLSTLYGIVFLSHQLGAFLGAWLGGLAYDRLGSYTPVWLAAIGLSLGAALIHLLINDRPLVRLQAASLRGAA
jgi:predicted MFS family arabinose efflux permease